MADDLSENDLLICLVEECGEVIQAATKCLRFGCKSIFPEYGYPGDTNRDVLAREAGELLAIIQRLPLDRIKMFENGEHKIKRIEDAKRLYGEGNG